MTIDYVGYSVVGVVALVFLVMLSVVVRGLFLRWFDRRVVIRGLKSRLKSFK